MRTPHLTLTPTHLRPNSLQSPHEDESLHILATLPRSYPSTSPPQLQLLSRYVGPFIVDPALSGPVLRTYFSSLTGVAWTAGDVAVFDGVEHVREKATQWYVCRELGCQSEGDELTSECVLGI